MRLTLGKGVDSMNKRAGRNVRAQYNAYCELCAKQLGAYKTNNQKLQAEAAHNIRVHHAKARDMADATYNHAARDTKHRHAHTPVSKIRPKKRGWSF